MVGTEAKTAAATMEVVRMEGKARKEKEEEVGAYKVVKVSNRILCNRSHLLAQDVDMNSHNCAKSRRFAGSCKYHRSIGTAALVVNTDLARWEGAELTEVAEAGAEKKGKGEAGQRAGPMEEPTVEPKEVAEAGAEEKGKGEAGPTEGQRADQTEEQRAAERKADWSERKA